LVFIRDKKVKGHSYAYLVKNTWDNSNGKVKQKIIKYLGRSSKVTLKDIPEDFQEDPNILSFIACHSSNAEKMEFSMKEKMLELLINNDIETLFKTFEKYSSIFGLVKFYERLLTPVMYKVGELWSKGILDVATEHVCSNAAHGLVKIINEKISSPAPSRKVKILLCTPEGEFHNLGCMIIESFLKSKGYSVFNISPSVPSRSVISFADKFNPDLIMISITLTENISAANRLINAILDSKISYALLLVGGIGVESIKIQNNKSERVKFLSGIMLNGILHSIKEFTKDKPKFYSHTIKK
jgi:MerR family transcriptional regulator, light-induced transcriptional regulator